MAIEGIPGIGLTDTAALNAQLEAERREQVQALLAQGGTAQRQAGVAAGAFLGGQLQKLAGKFAQNKSQEREDAEAVDRATSRTRTQVASTPQELRSADPFEQAIDERRILVEELRSEGLNSQADAIRSQIVQIQTQQQEFAKLEGETGAQALKLGRDQREFDQEQKGLREKDEVTRHLNEIQQLDLTDPVQASRADRLDARLDKLTQITGTTEFDVPFDEVTIRRADKNLQETVGALDGFLEAEGSFSPEFLQLKGKVQNFALRVSDIAGLDLDEDSRAQLTEFARFRQVTSTNLNAYIKAITGAQMSNPEAIRLAQDVPTKNDSPQEYLSKLHGVTRRLSAIRDRTLEALTHEDDPNQFRRVIATPLQEFMPKEATVEEDADRAAAQAALARLRGQ